MHPYATDSAERVRIPRYIAAISMFLAWLPHSILGELSLVPPWWITAPSVIGFYGLLYKMFDKWLWKWKWLRKINLVTVPDLNGKWQGQVMSSHDDFNEQQEATLEIKQTWTEIAIRYDGSQSTSRSKMAFIFTKTPSKAALAYQYFNEPRPHANETMHAHQGFTSLTLTEGDKWLYLKGDYFSGRDRKNIGNLSFRRHK